MALQQFPSKSYHLWTWADPSLIWNSGTTLSTLDAAGESRTFIGHVRLEGGSGSKTISSSGGKIWWRSGSSVTFANAASNLRIGIQDVGATGLEDGTFDVYADLVGGTDSIATNTNFGTPMETGSKTISHGDLIAISIELTARGGVDSVQLARHSIEAMSLNFPYLTNDTGSGPSRSGADANPTMIIEFDDGTIGWLDNTFYGSIGLIGFNSGSTPDEYALIFQVPFKCSLIGAAPVIGAIASTDNFEVILYSDPLGTPVAERTTAVNPNLTGSTGNRQPYFVRWSSSFTLSANTNYAIAVRPTTANSIELERNSLGSGNDKLRRIMTLGENLKQGTRTNQTGAFTETNDMVPQIALLIDKFDDGLQPVGQAKVVQASGSY